MKTKLLAMMLLAGGSMFAQSRFSIGIGFRGHGAGYYQAPPSYASNIPPCPGPDYTWVDGYWSQGYGGNTWIAGYWNRQPFSSSYEDAPRFDNRISDANDQRGFNRGYEQDRSRGFENGRNFSGQDRNQTHAFNQGLTRDMGPSQNQNHGAGNQGGNRNQDSRQGNSFANGFRGR